MVTIIRSIKKGTSPNGKEFMQWKMEFAYKVKKNEGLADVKIIGVLTITPTTVEYYHHEESNLLPTMQIW